VERWLPYDPTYPWLHLLYHHLAHKIEKVGMQRAASDLTTTDGLIRRYLRLQVTPSVKVITRIAEWVDMDITLVPFTNNPTTLGSSGTETSHG
jgi:hypothetical protein